MNKRYRVLIGIVSLIIISCAILVSCGEKDKKILNNGDFEAKIGSSTASSPSWEQKKSNDKAGSIYYDEVKNNEETLDGKIGKQYVRFIADSSDGGELYSYQNVNLKKGKTYKLSVDMKIDSDIKAGKKDAPFVGAFVGFVQDNNFKGIQETKKTDGWVHREIYFRNDNVDSEQTVRIGIGATNGYAIGTVLFDNLQIERVNKVPSGVDVQYLGNKTTYKNSSKDAIFITFMSLLSIAVTVAAGVFIYLSKKKDETTLNNNDSNKVKYSANPFVRFVKSNTGLLSISILTAFLIRFLVMYFAQPMLDDVTKIGKLSLDLAKFSPTAIYTETNTTMPYGMMYLYWFIGLFANALHMSTTSFGLGMLIRLPALIAELLTCYIIFTMVYNYFGKRMAFIASMLYSTLPVFFLANSQMAMISPVSILFALIMVYAMLDKKHVLAISMFFVGWMFNYYMLILLPVLLYYCVYAVVNDKNSRSAIAYTLPTGLLTYFILAIPFDYTFFKKAEIFHVFTQQGEAFRQQTVFSNDVFNLYSMFGKGDNNITLLFTVLSIIYLLCVFSYMIYAYFYKNNRSDILLLSSFLFISLASIGSKANFTLYLIGLIILLVYTMLVNDIRLYGIFSLFSLFLTVNMTSLMSNSGYLSNDLNKVYTSFAYYDPLYITFSVFSVLLTIYFAYVIITIVQYGKICEIKDAKSILIGQTQLIENRVNLVKEKKEKKEKEVIIEKRKAEKPQRENYGIKNKNNKKK